MVRGHTHPTVPHNIYLPDADIFWESSRVYPRDTISIELYRIHQLARPYETDLAAIRTRNRQVPDHARLDAAAKREGFVDVLHLLVS